MTRHSLIAVAAAAAMLGVGGAPVTRRGDWDGEESPKEREEREARLEAQLKATEAARAARIGRERREREDFEKLRNGIEPATGRPLSRQRRRALSRQNFPFVTGDEA